jgi:two-component system chemotaxis response regulator CheB
MATDRTSGTSEPAAPTVTSVPVVLVDDSRVQRRFLRSALEITAEFEVIGEASNGREAVAMVERLRPAAVLMDLELPLMNGIEAIERIMASRPTPIVVCSGYVAGDARDNAAAATAAGAVDIVAKPLPETAVSLDDYAEELRRRLRVASRVKVITHPRGRLRPSVSPLVRAPRVPATEPPRAREPGSLPELQPLTSPVQVLAIGASTGGPQAVAQLLSALPSDLEQAVLVVQHMADGFIEGLAGWLDGMCALPVVVGASGRRLLPGTVTVAPSGQNLVVLDRLRVVCEQPPPAQFHVPGIDVTFRSVAAAVGAEAIGVLLTGMGRDGAVGLKAMRDRGAVTLGQDEATSAVYGMPAAAQALGAVEHELPLPAIAPALLQLLGHEVPEGPS